jgi:hypothetical protein
MTTEQSLSTIEEVTVSSSEKVKSTVTKETVMRDLESLIELHETEIQKARESNSKNNGVKFLRQVLKNLKILKKNINKTMKSKKVKKVRTENDPVPMNGFSKPIQISKELSRFCGWKVGELHSRSDVTIFLSAYFKEKNLKDPENPSMIMVDKDERLHRLLSIGNPPPGPVKFCLIQRYIKNHFIKPETSTKESATKESATKESTTKESATK